MDELLAHKIIISALQLKLLPIVQEIKLFHKFKFTRKNWLLFYKMHEENVIELFESREKRQNALYKFNSVFRTASFINL
tara:strand:+ start:5242 stop:5478 length:237 start_codon:yes stop_codon:yes gene_type:complete